MGEGHRYWVGIIAMLFLGMLFLVSGVGKLFMQATSVDYPLYLDFLPAGLSQGVHVVLPYIEAGIGILLILGVGIRFTTSLASFLIVAFIISNIIMIVWGYGAEPCQCFGMNGRLTVTASLVLDVIMAALTIIIFACYRGNFFNAIPLILTTGHKVKGAPSLGAPEA